jgi:prepilin-type N-terminal cleavage/methylation domain-containing protein/prepilin-type processing-associated H-X9-DG protein
LREVDALNGFNFSNCYEIRVAFILLKSDGMKPRLSNQRNHALTLIEVLVVIVVLVILAAMLLPAGNGGPTKARRINCVNNLKQIDLAYIIWAGDHNDKFPMQVSITDTNGGGTMELANGTNAWINFVVMSNELSTPRILYCPADTDHIRATNFTTDFNNGKISYFVGLDVTNESDSRMFLSGDDNFEISGVPVKSGLLELSTNAPISWTAARHKSAGNIGLADGSVQEVNQNQLRQAIQQTGLATNRFAIP